MPMTSQVIRCSSFSPPPNTCTFSITATKTNEVKANVGPSSDCHGWLMRVLHQTAMEG